MWNAREGCWRKVPMVNARLANGLTPVLAAAVGGRLDTRQLLLAEGR
jgi:hypothetical protein